MDSKTATVKYCIHTPADWPESELEKIKSDLSDLKAQESIEAAIGEGAGGHGFETIVEFLIQNPVISGVVSAIIWDITKALYGRRPTKNKTPESLPKVYRLVFHVENEEQNCIIGINLNNDIDKIQTSVKIKLDSKLQEGHSRLEQTNDNWEDYSN